MGEATGGYLSLPCLQALADAAQALLEAVAKARAPGPSPPGAPPPPSILTHASPSLADLVNEFLLSKARSGRADRYLRQLHVTLCGFARGREGQSAAGIAAREVESWLHSHGWQPRTQAGVLLDLRNLFNFAVRRSYLAANPALAVDMPRFDSPPPGIHTPDHVRQVLQLAGADPVVRRVIALRYFAGLRSAEALRLTEENILRGYVEVPAAKSKTRQRRLIPIQPNLRAWLALPGQLPLTQANDRLAALSGRVRAAGIPWPHNVTRHSFCSYHLARWQNAARTALEAGHSEAMLFAHYRELVTLAAARAFWRITP